MNLCVFTGRLDEDPELIERDGVSFLDLCIVVDNYRTTKSTNERSKTSAYLYCEAWASGAEVIAKSYKRGDSITIFATAKNIDGDDDRCVFRINEFE